MNRGALQSSPVQQMMGAGNPNWWNINNMRPPSAHPHHLHHHQQAPSPFMAPPSNLYPHFVPNTSNIPAWHNQEQLPESLSQLLLGGLVVGEEDHEKGSMMSLFQGKKLENWEEQVNVKQEHSYAYGHGSCEEFPAASWSHPIMASSSSSSPKSCVTSFSSNMLDFSNKSDHPHALASPQSPPLDRSSECNSTATGGALKKARVNQSSTPTTFKVRKEKLGDRITALHQLVSPFGKTDTASVLLEAIGYIRFLQSQIEALSLPYLGSGSGNMRQQQLSVHGERNCMFPEDPGQLLNDNCMKRKGAPNLQDPNDEAKKDLRSRGLCMVPISCTLQVGSDNGADYWAPALGGGFR